MLRARAEGLSVRACARAFGMSEHTVLALEEQRASEVATLKKDLAKDFRTLARLSVSRMIEEIDAMPRTALPVMAGIATDKMQVLEGEPSSITEHRAGESDKDRAKLLASIEALPVDVEVEEVKQPIAAGDVPGQKGGDQEVSG